MRVDRRLLRRPVQKDLDQAVRDTRKRIAEAVALYDQERDERAFGGRMLQLLEDGHTKATLIGRQRAGDFTPEEEDDRHFGRRITDVEMTFLEGFVEALAEGRYEGEDGSLDLDRIRRRARSYSGRMTGTANEAFALASGDDLIEWVLGEPETAHCEGEDSCPERAEKGPYTASTLPGFPGDNTTPCLFHCLCTLKRTDGVTAFRATE